MSKIEFKNIYFTGHISENLQIGEIGRIKLIAKIIDIVSNLKRIYCEKFNVESMFY